MSARFVWGEDAEVTVRTVSHVQDGQQILLPVWLLPTRLARLVASSVVLVADAQTLDGVHVHRIGDSLAALVFVALDLEGWRAVLLGLVQQDGPLDFVDDLLLVQEALI